MNRKKNSSSLSLRGKFIIGLIFIPTIIYWLTTSGQPIIDNYSFRQAQTAISADYLFENGVNLFNYQTPVLGKPWAIPFEFPIYQALVKIISTATSQSLTQVGRLTNSASILLSAMVCVSILSRNRVKQLYIIIFSLLLATSQVYLYYGRTFLIDGTALLFTLAAAFYYIQLRFIWTQEAFNAPKKYNLFPLAKTLLFSTFLILGMLIKATTSLPLICFIAIDQIHLACTSLLAREQFFKAIKNGIFFGIISLFTIFLTKSWVNHADKLKELNSNAAFILSKNLTGWNFGSLNDRLEPGKWSFLLSATSTKILNFGILLPMIIFAAFAVANILTMRCKNSAARRSTYICNFGFFMYAAGPLIFFNLYFIHEYYATANLAFGYLSLAASLNTISQCIERKNLLKLMKIFSVFITGLIGALQLYSFNIRYWPSSTQTSSDALEIANYVKNHSSSHDRLLTIGCDDWSSQLFYLSGLKGLAVRSFSHPENKQSIRIEIQKMINSNTKSIFIIENTKFLGMVSLGYLSASSKQGCSPIHKAGDYYAYKCNLEQFKNPTLTNK
ncbi:putative membrane protein [Synechococcus sp. BIOS-E4-1]|uniref:hypothetical protein n=1 Tax=Synechococcus sp. BIOS-E4-1 TaxID=1400864 RepID=UPI001648D8C8|nr:hypothetical protein [Synechococcus sp. BIOS-E4-1]QNI52788.1 putative membrane protein [Synechococcus sp. BIOS-E4-1]